MHRLECHFSIELAYDLVWNNQAQTDSLGVKLLLVLDEAK